MPRHFHLSIRLAAFVVVCSTSLPVVEAVDVYIVAGQSNGWRLSSLKSAPNQSPGARRVFYYGMKCVSEPERSKFQVLKNLDSRSMGHGLADALSELSDDDIIFIQYCRCGAGVWDRSERGWYPGDDPKNGKRHQAGLYGKFQKYLVAAEKSARQDHQLSWNVKGLFWHQGESDSNQEFSAYRKNVENLFYRFRQDLGTELPIVAAHIRELNDGDRTVNATLDALDEADDHFVVVKSNDLRFEADHDGKPNVHFALAGCLELGRRMAAAHTQLASKTQSDGEK